MVLVLIFALLSGCFLAALVGMLGRRRTIGFGWPFVLSLVFTPLVGLIIVLLSEKLPDGQKKGLGCIGGILAFLGFLCLLVFLLMLLGGGAMIAAL
ncbi:MAG: hypothetical protein J6A66_06615 [Alistipes sp.]|nr:hypothetical protein [Rikenellaceae bacterium]MBO5351260.1 hypothetical protein [Alistipes sp.]MBR4052733.1 hypothetical protein [Alistipes sp.]